MSNEFRHIVRIKNTDLDGTKKIAYALTGINGIGIRLASIIVAKANLDPDDRIGLISENEVDKLENIIENIIKYNLPYWLLNRPKDRETGKDLHLIGPDLVLQTKSDIDLMKKIKSWRGTRHTYGLKVRGQRTKTTARRKKSMVPKRRRNR